MTRPLLRLSLVAVGIVLITVATFSSLADPADAAVDPNLFVDELVDELAVQATAGEWLPDGRLLVLGRNGTISTSDPATGTTNQIMAMTNVSTAGERGALDLALHPDFATNGQFFVYHSTDAQPSRLRIVRFVLDETSGINTANSYSLIWENPGVAHIALYHVGGSLEISADGKLLLTIGDGFNSGQSDDLDNVFGKVIRLNLDGSIPNDNPFIDGAGPNLDEIYAYGLRNPFRGWVDPLTGEHWVGDVGGNTATQAYEEIDLIQSGGFYGWPACEGPLGQPKNGPDCPAGTIAPWHYYDHDFNAGCCTNRSITLGERYQSNQMPPEMQNAFIFGDWAENTFFWVEAGVGGAAGPVHEIPVNADARPVWISIGPDGFIYYIRYNPFPSVAYELRRIRYTGTVNQPPTVSAITATPASGPAPLVATFGSDADDVDGDTITYAWNFGDGATSTDPNPVHTYTTAGSFLVSLTITANGDVAIAPSITVQVGLPPQVTITSPANGSMFRAGDQLTLDATGTDADGPLTTSSYAWTIDLLHEEHAHGVFADSVGQTLPFDIATTGHDYRGATGYRIRVTVTDSDGLSDTDTVDVFPDKIDLTVLNNLADGTVTVDGTTQLVPYVLDTAIGFTHTIEAPSPLCVNNSDNVFVSWSDGGAQSHLITAPTTDATFAATYALGPQCIPCGTDWEAEAGTDVVTGFQVAADPTASADNYLHVPDNTLGNMLTAPTSTTPTVEYCVDIPYDGTWFIEGLVASVDLADSSNSFYVRMDGGTWQDWRYADSLAWSLQEASNAGGRFEWALTAGVHSFEIAFREDGAKIDRFDVRSDDPPPQSPPNVVMTEIRYAPESGQSEYLEIYNNETNAIDLSDWDLGGLATIAPGTILRSGGRLVLAADVAALDAEFPGAALTTMQPFDPGQSLSNAGQLVQLRDSLGAVIDEVSYLSSAPWPSSPSTSGAALERTSPVSNGSDPGSWTASTYGTPGATNGAILCGGYAITIDLNVTPGEPATAGDDVILGTPADDLIVALAGNDVICAGSGNDTVNGGEGNDLVLAESGDDSAFGLDGADSMFGGAGADELIGFGGPDALYGGQGDDVINGGPGDDLLRGHEGNDRIFGQGGNDAIDAGIGDDLVVGSEGLDDISGGAGADTLNGGPDADTVRGGDGNDLIFGSTGDDPWLSGDAGDDRVFGQLGADTVDGGSGNDLLWGNENDDVLTDPSGTNVMNGGPGHDSITGGSGDDDIFGDGSLLHEGDDVIDGGLGSDLLIGFAGNDTIIANDGVADVINGGPHTIGDTCTVDVGVDTVFNCNP